MHYFDDAYRPVPLEQRYLGVRASNPAAVRERRKISSFACFCCHHRELCSAIVAQRHTRGDVRQTHRVAQTGASGAVRSISICCYSLFASLTAYPKAMIFVHARKQTASVAEFILGIVRPLSCRLPFVLCFLQLLILASI